MKTNGMLNTVKSPYYLCVHLLSLPFTASSVSEELSLEFEADNDSDSKLGLLELVLPKLLLASKLPVLFLATMGIGLLGVCLGMGEILLVLATVLCCLVNEL